MGWFQKRANSSGWRETRGEKETTWANLVPDDTVIGRVRPTRSLEDPGVIFVTKGMGSWTLEIHREGLRWWGLVGG